MRIYRFPSSVSSMAAIAALVLGGIPAHAGSQGGAAQKSMDPASPQAIQETQRMMTTPGEREKVVGSDPRAKAVLDQAQKVIGEENMADALSLASELMGVFAQEAGGDPIKMMELLAEVQKNPELLEKKLTPEQRARLNGLAARSPAAQAVKSGATLR